LSRYYAMRKFAQESETLPEIRPAAVMRMAQSPAAIHPPQRVFAIAMKQFVPLTDEMLYSRAGPLMRLVPYRCGMLCHRGPDEEREPLQRLREWHEEAVIPSALLAVHRPA